MNAMSTAEMRIVEITGKAPKATAKPLVASLAWPIDLFSWLIETRKPQAQRRPRWYEDTATIMSIGDD
jgi:hypothetical protein